MKRMIVFSLLLLAFGACKDSSPKMAGGQKENADAKDHSVALTVFPAESIFNLKDTFLTQDGAAVTLASLAGKPTVVAMIFTNCGYACPRITDDMKGIEDQLKPNEKGVNFLLVSFDIIRDIPTQLKAYAQEKELDGNWTLLHGSEDATRTVSVLLNVQYQKDADGNFSHSNIISVLDKNGVPRFHKEGLEANHLETIAQIKSLMN